MGADTILMCIPGGFVNRFFSDEEMARLRAMGDVVVRNDLNVKNDADNAAYAALVAELKPRIVVTGWGSPRLEADTVRAVPELQYMCHATGSVRANTTREAMEAGILVTNWGRVGARPVAEGALMMILASLRRAWPHNRRIHQDKEWPRDTGGETLYRRRVGLHGLGFIAQETALLLKPFECRISAYSPHCPDETFEEFGIARAETLTQLYAENDIISVHASKTDANFHIVNAAVLAAMPDGAHIVNTARGAVIDTEALIKELQSGRIWAALDVFEKEPLEEDSPLRGMDNCLLFAHMGGEVPGTHSGIGPYAVDNIERFLKGEPVESVVPAAKYDLMT